MRGINKGITDIDLGTEYLDDCRGLGLLVAGESRRRFGLIRSDIPKLSFVPFTTAWMSPSPGRSEVGFAGGGTVVNDTGPAPTFNPKQTLRAPTGTWSTTDNLNFTIVMDIGTLNWSATGYIVYALDRGSSGFPLSDNNIKVVEAGNLLGSQQISVTYTAPHTSTNWKFAGAVVRADDAGPLGEFSVLPIPSSDFWLDMSNPSGYRLVDGGPTVDQLNNLISGLAGSTTMTDTLPSISGDSLSVPYKLNDGPLFGGAFVEPFPAVGNAGFTFFWVGVPGALEMLILRAGSSGTPFVSPQYSIDLDEANSYVRLDCRNHAGASNAWKKFDYASPLSGRLVMVTVVFAATSYVRINNTNLSLGTESGTFPSTFGQAEPTISSEYNASTSQWTRYAHSLLETVGFSGVLSWDDIYAVEAYLANKWGVVY